MSRKYTASQKARKNTEKNIAPPLKRLVKLKTKGFIDPETFAAESKSFTVESKSFIAESSLSESEEPEVETKNIV